MTLAALSEDAARSLAKMAMNGDAETRTGAAEILSRNILTAPERDYCAAQLIRLFADSDSQVRRAAGQWAGRVRVEGRIGPLRPVAEAFVASPAFTEGAENFFRAIEKAVDAPPGLVLRAGHCFLEIVGSAAGDVAGSKALAAKSLSSLTLRAYRQAEAEPDLRQQCLDLFDHLLQVGGYGADEAMEAFGR